jgi:CRISPR/Cas system-associated endoribonuclease Cas2
LLGVPMHFSKMHETDSSGGWTKPFKPTFDELPLAPKPQQHTDEEYDALEKECNRWMDSAIRRSEIIHDFDIAMGEMKWEALEREVRIKELLEVNNRLELSVHELELTEEQVVKLEARIKELEVERQAILVKYGIALDLVDEQGLMREADRRLEMTFSTRQSDKEVK